LPEIPPPPIVQQPSHLTPAEQSAWDQAEAQRFDADSVERLIKVYVLPRALPEGLLVRDVAERFATVRGSAYNANSQRAQSEWEQGDYGDALSHWVDASVHLTAGLIESFGAAIFGRTSAETARNVIKMYAIAAALGGLGSFSRQIAARPSLYPSVGSRFPISALPPAAPASGPPARPPKSPVAPEPVVSRSSAPARSAGSAGTPSGSAPPPPQLSVGQRLLQLRDQALDLAKKVDEPDSQGQQLGNRDFGNLIDAIFKSFVLRAQQDGLLPSGLRVTPRGRYGPDVYDPAIGKGWDLTTATDRQVAGHDIRYITGGQPFRGRPLPDGTVINEVDPLVYTRN
jgi:hypothetical protein